MKKIAIIGAGPAGLFMFKRLIDSNTQNLAISIFEKQNVIGAGMPYSEQGASTEHVTNVSGNEIPSLVHPLQTWIEKAPSSTLNKYGISKGNFNDYKVLPRLLFGEYLAAQFVELKKGAVHKGISTTLYTQKEVVDIKDCLAEGKVKVFTNDGKSEMYDIAVICTGHRWPVVHENKVPGWYDSPYPPAKLSGTHNYAVAVKGASLSAIDAVKTLARCNGKFTETENKTFLYTANETSPHFKIVLHSLGGLLPGVRFHLQDSHLSTGPKPLTKEEIETLSDANGGFVPLDYIFERNFKQPLQQTNSQVYDSIKNMTLEEFVEYAMALRENLDAFELLKAEYLEAEKSIKRQQSVYWKEMLAELSYAINYPAKHLSAEDMLRLKKILMPLISIIIAFVPQNSCRELLALQEAGHLSLQPVDSKSKVAPVEDGGAAYTYYGDGGEETTYYKLFVDATGQRAFMVDDFPFETLKNQEIVSPAFLKFRDADKALQEIMEGNQNVAEHSPGHYYLKVPGVNINDNFQLLDKYGAANDRIYIMSVPYIAGLNPDYSGLDFCETASAIICKHALHEK